MNIKIEKRKYTPPFMEVLYMKGVSSLLRGSYGEDDDEDEVELEELDEGYDDEFG
ncbi:MAG: hypothetical protein IJ905_06445 [Fibrobacter sp.]|nr:hypothetical protein [Fibrobacter sp.]